MESQDARASPPVAVVDKTFLKKDPTFGNSAFAAVALDIGEIVLQEDPWLRMIPLERVLSAEKSPDELEWLSGFALPSGFREVAASFARLCAAHNAPMSLFDAMFSIVVDATCTSQTVAALERDLYAPPLDAVSNRLERVVVMELLSTSKPYFESCFPPWCSSRDFWVSLAQLTATTGVQRALSLIHSFRVNVHEAESRGFVFHKASKFAHSCNANTYWYLSGGRVHHVALRPIAEGELLTFSYIGTGLNVLQPTLLRREKLHELNFTCACPRCAEYDQDRELCRSLRCPECSRCRTAPQGSGDPSLRLSPSRGAWVCDQCGCSLWKEEALSLVLWEEQCLATLTMQLFFSLKSVPNGDRLRERVSRWDGLALIMERSDNNPLSLRWEACRAVGDILGHQHYLFPCSFSGSVNAMLTALRLYCSRATRHPSSKSNDDPAPAAVGRSNDFVAFVEQRRRRTAVQRDSASWVTDILRGFVWVRRWFATHAPGSAQEAKVLLQTSELLLALKRDDADCPVARLLLPEEREVLQKFSTQLALDKDNDPQQRFGPLLAHHDFRASFLTT